MSSFLDKLKTLLNAQARGSRRDRETPGGQKVSETGSVPEVVEARPLEEKPQEVTDAPVPPQVTSLPVETIAPLVEEAETAERDETGGGALEEERVADLIKGDQS
jgi:hypothetical protein